MNDGSEQKQRATEPPSRLGDAAQQRQRHVVLITTVIGDITQQTDCDAIVNAANPLLRKGGGVCGAIHRAAGQELEADAIRLGPIEVGEAVITSGYKLPNKWVIHVVGPRYTIDSNPAELLAKALRNVLELADKREISRIAIPAISTGIYGYPMAEAGPILLNAAQTKTTSLKFVREIRFVLTSPEALALFRP